MNWFWSRRPPTGGLPAPAPAPPARLTLCRHERLDRMELEVDLLQLVDDYEDALSRGYMMRHPSHGSLSGRITWSLAVGLVSQQEYDVWVRALHVRHLILLRELRVCLADIQRAHDELQRVVEDLRGRVGEMEPGDDSNVVRLRRNEIT